MKDRISPHILATAIALISFILFNSAVWAQDCSYSQSVDFDDGTIPWKTWGDAIKTVENGELKITLPEGRIGGGSGAGSLIGLEPAESGYASYEVCFADNFDFVKGGKLPGLCGGDCPTGGKVADNGFSSRYMWKDGGRLVLYFYHLHKSGTWGEHITVGQVDAGQCVTLTQYVQLNTVGQKDGIINIWVNGEQTLSMQDVEFRTSDWEINTFYFSNFFGGGTMDYAPSKDETLYFDNFLYGTGCSSSVNVPAGGSDIEQQIADLHIQALEAIDSGDPQLLKAALARQEELQEQLNSLLQSCESGG